MKENQYPNPGAGKEDAPGQNKEYNLIVNASPETFVGKEISFKQIVELAYGQMSEDPNVIYTVSFEKGPNDKHEGTMVKGQSVKLKEGMEFHVTETNRS